MAWSFEPRRIVLAREANDVSQSKLAEMIGCTTQQLSAWELGKNLPNQDSFMKICNALNIPPRFFFVNDVDDDKQQVA